MFTPIGTYVPSFTPITNITPFTYRDGETYLTTLETFRKFINVDLINYVNNSISNLNDSVTADINQLIITVNAALTSQELAVIEMLIAQNEEVDSKLADLTTEVTNQINNAVTAINTALAEQTADNAAELEAFKTQFMSDIDETTAALIEASDSDVHAAIIQLITESGGAGLTDAGVNSIIEDTDSETRTTLDTLYGGDSDLDDAGIAALITTPASATRIALDALYSGGGGGGLDDAGVAALIGDSDSDTSSALYGYIGGSRGDEAVSELINNEIGYTRLALESIFGKSIITYPFWEDIDERAAENVFKVTSIPNCLWVDTPWGYRNIGIPHFETTANIYDFVSAPYNGMVATVGSSRIEVRYNEDLSKWVPWNSQWLGTTNSHTQITSPTKQTIYFRFVNGNMEMKADVIWGSTLTAITNMTIPVPYGYLFPNASGNLGEYCGEGYYYSSSLSKSYSVTLNGIDNTANMQLRFKQAIDGVPQSNLTIGTEGPTLNTVLRWNAYIKINPNTADFVV